MQQKQHIASHEAKRGTASQERRQTSTTGTEGGTVSPDASDVALIPITIRVSPETKWTLREIAAREKTTMGRLAVQVIEDFVRENKGAAA